MGGRAGRPRNRRLCVGRVPRGPLSRGDRSLLGGETLGFPAGRHRRRGAGEPPLYDRSLSVLLDREWWATVNVCVCVSCFRNAVNVFF